MKTYFLSTKNKYAKVKVSEEGVIVDGGEAFKKHKGSLLNDVMKEFSTKRFPAKIIELKEGVLNEHQ